MRSFFGFFPVRLTLAALVAAGTCVWSGCMSSRYHLVKNGTPVVPLKFAASAGATPEPVAAVLETVIVLRGPGSWKRDAYWDEYVVKLTNHGTEPVVIDAATLTGLGANTVMAATHPWKLEKESRSALHYNFGLAKDITVRVGTGALAVVGGTAAGVVAGGGLWAASSAMVLGGTVLFAAPVIGGTIYRNVAGRHKVEDEFNRRRLRLPLTLAAGQEVQGSLFFRIMPGPEQLTFGTRNGTNQRLVTIPLDALAQLHLVKANPPVASAGWPAVSSAAP